MRLVLSLVATLLVARPLFPATFGTVVAPTGGAAYSDLILDQPRNRLYLVNSTANRIEVYNLATRAFLSPIRTDTQPVAAAMSPDGKSLYVTAYSTSALDVIDLDKQSLSSRTTIPSSPEGVAVGGDGRVLITTIGTTGSQFNTLYIYDPKGAAGNNLSSVALPFPPPTSPVLPAVSGRVFISYRSKLITTKDGRYIIGANGISGTNRVVFVYEVASASVLRGRNVSNLSNVLAVSPDGTKFMAGSSLFDTQTLQVIAQENIANSPFAFPAGNASNFNLQQNQGGSVFAPDGSKLYAAFNIAPVQNPPARANVTRLLVNDPDNLLITLGLQLPENLVGRMEINSAGDTAYAISESGFMILPVGTIAQSPIAQPDSQVVFLATDQCGVVSQMNSSQDAVNNAGRGRLTVNAQPYTLPNTAVGGLGGPGGPGGTIIFPLPGGGGVVVPIGGGFPVGGIGNQGNQAVTTVTAAAGSTTPTVQTIPTASGATLNFIMNPTAARNLGTVAPSDFLVQSPEAINIPANVRVYQNTRNAEARGTIVPVSRNISTGEGLINLVADTTRQRLYITNSGQNRVEVFDLRTNKFLAPIKVGQLPHALAFGTDGNTLYVANTGGESISIVDLTKGLTTGTVKFPPLPFNSGLALVTPSDMASSQRGPQIVMSDGTLWKVDGDQAIPRTLNPAVFGTNVRTVAAGNPAIRTMAATPGGEYVILATGQGNAYLYDAGVDDYTIGRQVFSTQPTGLVGSVTAGPRGQYYVVNGTLLNASLTPVASPPTVGAVTGGALPTTTTNNATTSRPVSAVASVNATTFARFTQPILTNQNAAATDAGIIETVDAATGNTLRQAMALEGAPSTATGNQRIAINGRTLYVDPNGTNAYALTASGLSVIPMTPVNPSDAPVLNNNGVVSEASYLPAVADGGLISIFGRNLAQSATPSSSAAALPTVLGGVCVTLNNVPLPLLLTSSGQINAQIPPTLAAGRYSLVVRSIDKQAASFTATVSVTKYAPAVFVAANGQPAILHADRTPVTKDSPAKRDEHLVLYATGLGPTKGGAVTAGKPAPSNPLAVTDKVQVYFGDPKVSGSEIIVNWSGLVPGFVGLNQINLTVPGNHIKGDAVPVTLKIGGVTSPTTGPAVPKVAVQ